MLTLSEPLTSDKPGARPSPVLVGLDIGGSSTKVVAVDAADPAVILDRARLAAVGTDAPGMLADYVRHIAGGRRVERVGVTVPGIVADGQVRASTNIPQLVGVRLADELLGLTGSPTTLNNDGTAAALAEARLGAGRLLTDVFVMVLGTGIAGAHVIGGRIRLGAHDQAGELGHTRVAQSRELCSCGATGCLESAIGAPALLRAWHSAGGKGDLGMLHDAVRSGDTAANMVLEQASAALASALLTLSALVDPACVIVGGGVAEVLPDLVTRAADTASRRATFHQVPPVVPAEFGPWAGAVGSLLT